MWPAISYDSRDIKDRWDAISWKIMHQNTGNIGLSPVQNISRVILEDRNRVISEPTTGRIP